MNYDILFLDQTAPGYYDRLTLEKSALGGTEATIVRIADALGSLGLTVGVIQTRCKPFDAIIAQHAFFLHIDNIPADTTCNHFIQVRGISALGLFPKAKQYVWLHDVSSPKMKAWVPKLKSHDVTLIGVSRWHKKDIEKHTGYDKVKYIYNPVQDEIYVPVGYKPQYNSELLVWLSSPHKGLGDALLMFDEVRKHLPKMQLLAFNPGYIKLNKEALITRPGVSYYGPMACKQVWNVAQKALCVFYPTTIEETFGLVAAEANAVGTPLASYRKGALKEIVSSDNQLVEDNDQEGLIQKVVTWSKEGRPLTYGKDEFKLSSVRKAWLDLLSKT